MTRLIGSLDIETFGTTPSSLVLSVGYAVVDIEDPEFKTKAEFLVRPSLDQQPGRKIREETMQWWMEQKPEILRAQFTAQRVPIEQIFQAFRSVHVESIWAVGAAFDFAIMRDLFDKAGFDETPWAFYRERCLRTVREVLDPTRQYAPPANTEAHDALADAVWQAKYVHNLYAKGLLA
jgi:hypothetical protein